MTIHTPSQRISNLINNFDLSAFLHSPDQIDDIADCYDLLEEAEIKTINNKQFVDTHAAKIGPLTTGLRALALGNILTQEYFDILTSHLKYADTLGNALLFLKHTTIFTEENIQALLLGKGAHASAFIDYCQNDVEIAKRVTQSDFNRCMERPWQDAKNAIEFLTDKTELPTEIADHIAEYLIPDYTADASPSRIPEPYLKLSNSHWKA